MPAQICHVLAGKQSRIRAGVSLPSTQIPAFNMGCQGPDVFAHNRRTRPFALAYARLLHRRGYGSFCRAAAELLMESSFPHAQAWLAGFVTHQAVDRALHPYIVYRSFQLPLSELPGVSPALYHAFFERILDVLVLRSLSGRNIFSFNMDPLFYLEESIVNKLSCFIAEALRKTYSEKTDDDLYLEKRIKNAFNDTLFFYNLTNPCLTHTGESPDNSKILHFYDRGPAGVALLYPEYPSPAIDWLNEEKNFWKNPANGVERTASVLNLFEEAVSIGTNAITTLFAVLEGRADSQILEKTIGNSCLSIQKSDGSIAPVLYAEPFDLPSELAREFKKREAWVSKSVDPVKDELV